MSMTDKEKQTQIALGTYLPLKWAERNKLHTEGSKLYAEAAKLEAEATSLHLEGRKLHAEGRKLYSKAVIGIYGHNAIIDWDTGEVKV